MSGKPIAGVGRRQASIPPTRDPQNCAKTSHPAAGRCPPWRHFCDAGRGPAPARWPLSSGCGLCAFQPSRTAVCAQLSAPRAFSCWRPRRARYPHLQHCNTAARFGRSDRRPRAEHRVHPQRRLIIAKAAATKPPRSSLYRAACWASMWRTETVRSRQVEQSAYKISIAGDEGHHDEPESGSLPLALPGRSVNAEHDRRTWPAPTPTRGTHRSAATTRIV